VYFLYVRVRESERFSLSLSLRALLLFYLVAPAAAANPRSNMRIPTRRLALGQGARNFILLNNFAELYKRRQPTNQPATGYTRTHSPRAHTLNW